jgi:hypothetical protein
MPFQFADLIITVIHRRETDDLRPPPPIPWMPDRPTEIDELRAILEHAIAQLNVGTGAEMGLPANLTEVVGLEQHLVAALKEVRELKAQYSKSRKGILPDQTGTYDAGPEEDK